MPNNCSPGLRYTRYYLLVLVMYMQYSLLSVVRNWTIDTTGMVVPHQVMETAPGQAESTP